MNRQFAFLGAVLLVLILAMPARADIIRAPDLDLSGTGLGAVFTVLTIQADPSESGCVHWTGSADATGTGCPVVGFGGDEHPAQSFTHSIGDLGLTDFSYLRIVFEGIEAPGGDRSIQIDDLVLLIQNSSGTLLATHMLPSAVYFDALPGTGQGAYNFMLDQAQVAQANAYLTASNRLGLAATLSLTSSGHETFFFTTVIPEPMSLLLIGAGLLALGLARGRRRKTQP